MKQVTNTDFLTNVLALTAENQIAVMADNVFDNNAGLLLMKQKSRVNFRVSGYEILVNINLSKNKGSKSYQGFDTFNITPNKGAVTPYLRLANYAAPIPIDDESLEINKDKEKIIDVMQFFMQQAEDTLSDDVNTDLYGDGTGNAGKDMTGLGAMCEKKTIASQGSYMNVSDSTYWVNQFAESTQGAIIGTLRDLYLKTTDGKDAPDVILASTEFIDQYENANESTSGVSVTYGDTRLADAGFASLQYKGIPMVLDKALDATDTGTKGLAYMLNSKYLGFELRDMKFTPFVRPADQLAAVSYLKYRCQLVTNRRNRQGVIQLT